MPRILSHHVVVPSLWSVVVSVMVVRSLVAAGPMFDPAIDRPDQEWCYAAQSTTVIGLPFVPEPVQVTYDGAIYTRRAELALFCGDGKTLTPVMARNKTFLEGWIPVVGYAWQAGGIDYRLEIFSAELPKLGRENLVQFASLTMANRGTKPAEGVVAAGVRGSAGYFRLGRPRHPVTPTTQFAMKDGAVTRDAALLYTYSSGAELRATADTPYRQPYRAADYHITDRAATALAVYRRTLRPGQSLTATFAMPRVPVTEPGQVQAVMAANYLAQRERTVRYWRKLLGTMEFQIPEKRVNDSYRASLVHLILATRTQGGKPRQGSGLPYDALFLNDYIDMLLAYDTAGLNQFIEPNVDWLMHKQHASGMFIDVHNRGNDRIVTSHGQGLFALAYHAVMTRDKAYARKVYPSIRKGAALILHDHRTDKYHLMRPSIPYDAPMVTGHHTCHNLFALLALRTSIRVARLLGKTEDVAEWTKAEHTYTEAILKAIDDIYHKEGYIRSGLYDWTAGWVQGRKGRVNQYPNQDWENNLLVYPTELLAPDDPRLIHTLAEIRRRKYREGCMSYRNGMHVHQYVTLNQAQQYRAIGDQAHALLDLYHVLLHNGSTHEGFENLVVPWSTRTPSANCPPPHAWAAAKTALFLRDMMVCEYGGRAGMDPSQRDLYLYSLISPAWIQPGEKVAIRHAPTEMGRVSSTLAFTAGGAELTVQAGFHHPPRHIVFRVPYGVELDGFDSDAKRAFEKDRLIHFTPDVTRATIRWHAKAGANEGTYQAILKSYRREYDFVVADDNYDPARAGKPFLLADEKDHPAEPLSFDLVRRAFLKEYTRRFRAYVKDGGKPYPVQPPALWSGDERRAAYEKQFPRAVTTPKKIDPNVQGLAVGKPATASHTYGRYSPALAFDGNASDLQSSWQADPYPAWLKVDLGKPTGIDRIHVFLYWGGGRFYRYTIEGSLDGTKWTPLVDKSANRKPATPKGDLHRFPATTVRYVRITMLYHNLNKGVHVVELRVLPAPQK